MKRRIVYFAEEELELYTSVLNKILNGIKRGKKMCRHKNLTHTYLAKGNT